MAAVAVVLKARTQPGMVSMALLSGPREVMTGRPMWTKGMAGG